MPEIDTSTSEASPPLSKRKKREKTPTTKLSDDSLQKDRKKKRHKHHRAPSPSTNQKQGAIEEAKVSALELSVRSLVTIAIIGTALFTVIFPPTTLISPLFITPAFYLARAVIKKPTLLYVQQNPDSGIAKTFRALGKLQTKLRLLSKKFFKDEDAIRNIVGSGVGVATGGKDFGYTLASSAATHPGEEQEEGKQKSKNKEGSKASRKNTSNTKTHHKRAKATSRETYASGNGTDPEQIIDENRAAKLKHKHTKLKNTQLEKEVEQIIKDSRIPSSKTTTNSNNARHISKRKGAQISKS